MENRSARSGTQLFGKRQVATGHPAAILIVATLCTVMLGCGPDDELRWVKKPPKAPMMSPADVTLPIQTQWLGPRTVTVAPGIHVLGKLFPSAAFAIESDEGVILIDTGIDESAVALRESLLSVGVSVKDIRYVLLTHAHYDHVFGANQIRKMSGATVAAGQADCGVLREPDLNALYSLFPKAPYSGDSIRIDREVRDGDVIELGDVSIEVIAAPGHTPGSTCYLLNKGGKRILFSGDVIASLNYGPATYPAYLSPRFRGDAKSYLDSVRRLQAMPPPDLLLTGHPGQQKRMQSIVMDQAIWHGLLDPAETELQQLTERHTIDGADFLDDVAKPIEPGVFYFGQLDQIAVYGLIDQDHFVVFNAPGGRAFEPFLSDQLSTLGLPPRQPTAVCLTSPDPRFHSGLVSIDQPVAIVSSLEPAELPASDQSTTIAPDQAGNVFPVPVEVRTLDGYASFRWVQNGRRVLVTPDAPRNISLTWTDRQSGRQTVGAIEPQSGRLASELAESPTAATTYLALLDQLSEMSPDVWLPASPLSGQNANLYDDQWEQLIDQNRRAAD